MVAHHFIHIHGLDVLFGHDTGIDKAVVQADVAGSLGLLHEEHLQALLGAAARGDGAGDTRADNEHIGVDGFGYLVSIDGCGGSEERGLSRGGEVVATCRAAIRRGRCGGAAAQHGRTGQSCSAQGGCFEESTS